MDIDQINAIVAQAVADAIARTKEEDSDLRARIKEDREGRKDRHREERRQAGERPPSKIPEPRRPDAPPSKAVIMTVTPPPSPISTPPVDAAPDISPPTTSNPPPSTGTVVWGAIDGVTQWIETSECSESQ